MWANACFASQGPTCVPIHSARPLIGWHWPPNLPFSIFSQVSELGRWHWWGARDGSPRRLHFLWPGRTGHPQEGTFLKLEELIGKCLLIHLPPRPPGPRDVTTQTGSWEGLALGRRIAPALSSWTRSAVKQACQIRGPRAACLGYSALWVWHACCEALERVARALTLLWGSGRSGQLLSVSAPFCLPARLPALNLLRGALGQLQRFLESLRHLGWARVPSPDFQEKRSSGLLKLGVIICLRIS